VEAGAAIAGDVSALAAGSAPAAVSMEPRGDQEAFRNAADDAKQIIEEAVHKLKAKNARGPEAADAARRDRPASGNSEPWRRNCGPADDTAGIEGATGAQAAAPVVSVTINVLA
jgi:hypothetical protein